ncbi:MAG: LD-carboxypeptidase [Clostridia bacterium]|nr:LD-carboxypeptidase [Clostridia bacterium]
MIIPEFIKKGGSVGVCAPSCSLSFEDSERLQSAKDYFKSQGFFVIVSPNTVKDGFKAATADARLRAAEFSELYASDVGAIFAATGGELELDILEHLDAEFLRAQKPKWFCGYSDNTVLSDYLLTHLDTASLYGYNVGAYGDRPLDESTKRQFELICGSRRSFESYPLHQTERFDFTTAGKLAGYNLTEKTVITSIYGNHAAGRLFGGCLDVLLCILGTRFDKSTEFFDKYKGDGILFFLESCELNALAVYRGLSQMRYADYFKHATGFVFGRPLDESVYFDYSFEDAAKEALAPLRLPMFFGADLGHKPPSLPFVNGAVADVVANNGKMLLSYGLRSKC